MTDLCRLAANYGTDKAGWYTPIYDVLLSGMRKSVKKVLEIGVGTKEAMQHVPNYKPGASLRMWMDYFPYATVLGADIVRTDLPNVVQLDQSNSAQLQEVGKKYGFFDLIVDDGSHDPDHQALGANTLVPYLNPGGLYIIEDVNNFEEVTQALEYDALCISYPTTYKVAARCMVIRG